MLGFVKVPAGVRSLQAGEILFEGDIDPSSAALGKTRLAAESALYQMYTCKRWKPFHISFQSAVSALTNGQVIMAYIYGPDNVDAFKALSATERIEFLFSLGDVRLRNIWQSFDEGILWPMNYTALFTRPGTEEAELSSFCSVYLVASAAIQRPEGVDIELPWTVGTLKLDWDLFFVNPANQLLLHSEGKTVIKAKAETSLDGSYKQAIPPEMAFELPATALAVGATPAASPGPPGSFLGTLGGILSTVFPVAGTVVSVIDGFGRLFKGIRNESKKTAVLEEGSTSQHGTEFGNIPGARWNGTVPSADGSNIPIALMQYSSHKRLVDQGPYASATGSAYGTSGVTVEVDPDVPGYVGGHFAPSSIAGREITPTAPPVGFLDSDVRQYSTQIDGVTRPNTTATVAHKQTSRVVIPPGEVWTPYPFMTPDETAPITVQNNFLASRLAVLNAFGSWLGVRMDDNAFSGLSQVTQTIEASSRTATDSDTRGLRMHKRAYVVPKSMASRWYALDIKTHPFLTRIWKHPVTLLNWLRHSCKLSHLISRKGDTPTHARYYSQFEVPASSVAANHLSLHNELRTIMDNPVPYTVKHGDYKEWLKERVVGKRSPPLDMMIEKLSIKEKTSS